MDFLFTNAESNMCWFYGDYSVSLQQIYNRNIPKTAKKGEREFL